MTRDGACPRLNAAIGVATETAIQELCKVVGIRNGWRGFFDGD
ncbi:hypothetical protein ACFLUJ_08560 [Chloroflexota bacterium]